MRKVNCVCHRKSCVLADRVHINCDCKAVKFVPASICCEMHAMQQLHGQQVHACPCAHGELRCRQAPTSDRLRGSLWLEVANPPCAWACVIPACSCVHARMHGGAVAHCCARTVECGGQMVHPCACDPWLGMLWHCGCQWHGWRAARRRSTHGWCKAGLMVITSAWPAELFSHGDHVHGAAPWRDACVATSNIVSCIRECMLGDTLLHGCVC
jgi:hypothetical protein